MAAEKLSPGDPCSFSRPDECRLILLDLVWDIDFTNHVIIGTAYLDLEKTSASVNRVIFDTSKLEIRRVFCKESGDNLEYVLGSPVLTFGSKLEVTLPIEEKLKLTIGIEYTTSPESSALQWMSPDQTAGKRQPYLFSQCQAIHARSVVPCQDTPGVKFPYTAKVTIPKEVTALMSALRQGANVCRSEPLKMEYSFKQPIPVPSYLIAIVVGDLVSRDIGPRSKVWTEKEMIEEAAFEFSETEQMLKVAESLMGPYVWGQYDLLVLPPSFPYGGMENPCLTFVTPTLLAGDKSLANVVAHEITHSWTGNLVTNSNHEHFWLNEGHTTFVERKICARLGEKEPLRNLLAMIGWKNMDDYVMDQNTNQMYTKLVPTLVGVDLDDVFSPVPYEKGFALLFYLEELVGGPDVFEPFLKAYIDKFKYHSIDTYQWKEFLLAFFQEKGKKGALKKVDWDKWFFGTGMPPVTPKFDTSLADACHDLSQKWCSTGDINLGQFSSTDLDNFSTKQKQEFFNQLMLQEPFSIPKISCMENIYNLFAQKNSEIRFRWLRLCLRAKWQDCITHAIAFINEQGRMKFVRPIYKDLYAWTLTREQTVANFLAHKHEMHNLTATMLAKDLKLS